MIFTQCCSSGSGSSVEKSIYSGRLRFSPSVPTVGEPSLIFFFNFCMPFPSVLQFPPLISSWLCSPCPGPLHSPPYTRLDFMRVPVQINMVPGKVSLSVSVKKKTGVDWKTWDHWSSVMCLFCIVLLALVAFLNGYVYLFTSFLPPSFPSLYLVFDCSRRSASSLSGCAVLISFCLLRSLCSQ